MSSMVERVWNRIVDAGGNLDRQEWILVFVCVVIIGFFCLRGFGSRSSY